MSNVFWQKRSLLINSSSSSAAVLVSLAEELAGAVLAVDLLVLEHNHHLLPDKRVVRDWVEVHVMDVVDVESGLLCGGGVQFKLIERAITLNERVQVS